jgi:hypothetical protein
MKKYLTAKHWQLFISIFIVPWIIIDLGLSIFIEETSAILLGVLTALYYGWLWSIVSVAVSNLPAGARMKLLYFRIAVLVSVTVLVVVEILRSSSSEYVDNFKFLADKSGLLIPLISIGVICYFFVIGFVAKALKAAELDRKVKFHEYFIDCLLLWVYPIGMWFIQPRINILMKK